MDTRAASRRSSLSATDFILIVIIVGLLAVIVGVLAMRLLPSANPVIVMIATPTMTLTPAPTTPPTPSPTWTNTPTPTRTRTPTPTRTWTSTPTSPPPPLVNLALTVTPLPAGEVMTGTFGVLPSPAPLREFKPNTLNIILIGSDRRPGEGGWRTDTMILVSIDPDVPSLTMLSIPRDLWVYIPNWQWTRINLADGHGERTGFPGGGPGLLKQTIQYNFGVPVQYYARVDFAGFKTLIDAVGGIDVIADCPLYDIFPDVPDDVTDIIAGPELTTVPTGTIDIPSAGIYHLDGKHALWYARSRKTTSDFDRARRQHRVLRGLWGAIQQQGLVGQLPGMWDGLSQTVQTDLTLNDVVYLAQLGTQLTPTHIRSRFIDGTMLHYFVSNNGASVYAYNYDELEPILDEAFAEFPPNVASQAPAAVEVWNGVGNPDWERIAAERLSWAGFQASPNGVADRFYERTTIVDFTATQKGSRLPQLIRLFRVSGADVVYQPDAGSPVPYRVILGQNFDPCLRGSPALVATATPTPTSVPPTP